MRLAIHECDEEKRALEGKKCASKEDIQEYFKRTIVDLQMFQTKPSLTEYDNAPTSQFYTYAEYTTKPILD